MICYLMLSNWRYYWYAPFYEFSHCILPIILQHLCVQIQRQLSKHFFHKHLNGWDQRHVPIKQLHKVHDLLEQQFLKNYKKLLFKFKILSEIENIITFIWQFFQIFFLRETLLYVRLDRNEINLKIRTKRKLMQPKVKLDVQRYSVSISGVIAW